MGKLEKADEQPDEPLNKDPQTQPDGSRSSDAYHTSMKKDEARRIEPREPIGNGVPGPGRPTF